MRFPNGQPIRIPITVRDVNGNPGDAGALSLTVAKPDATQQTYTPTHDSTGQYHQDIPAAPDLAQNGHYIWVATATGLNAGVSRGAFDVFDPFEPTVLTLQDAKQVANIPDATTAYDNELQMMVDAVTAGLERITAGPIVNRSISERIRVSGYNEDCLAVRQRPLVSVTSITDIDSGQSFPLTDLDIDPVYGTIRRKRSLPFWGWGPWYTVVYVAGWGTAVPAAFNQAARLIIDHLWESQRGPGLAPVPGIDATLLPGMGFAIPNRALELLAPYTSEVYL